MGNPKPREVYDVLRVEGMAPGSGQPVPKHFKNIPATRVTGEGTTSDPYVGWVYDLTSKGARTIRRCTEIVKEEAIKLGMTYAWIRSVNHPVKSGWSKTNVQVLLPAQPHITVIFGRSASTMLWHGHIWTKNFADNSGAPQRILQPHEVEEKGGNPQLWTYDPASVPELTDESWLFGKVTREDPKVIWVFKPNAMTSQRAIRRCTEIAKKETKELGMSWMWIRSLNHPYKSSYITLTTRVVLQAQSHITVAFGTNDSTLLQRGQSRTKDMADKSGAPQRILEPSEVEEKGGNPQLWASGPYPYMSLPANYPY
ncbi:hypothetical protein F5Y06DRAFT_296433 [Hypoxylon sp. FL0890]|nr:hypothetical protein F5Y06DRAFT_296433 [Hypoxylon sp. FL0890]